MRAAATLKLHQQMQQNALAIRVGIGHEADYHQQCHDYEEYYRRAPSHESGRNFAQQIAHLPGALILVFKRFHIHQNVF